MSEGKLFVVEGTDGSGKSTQLYLLQQWLKRQGYPVFFTEWNSSDMVKPSTDQAKAERILTPTTFSLIHASDFADRYHRRIRPQLEAGYIVLSDRYLYTALARDGARGCDLDWIRDLYRFAVEPTAAFYFQAPLQVTLDRILRGRPQLKHYEAGMDLNLSENPLESYRQFQGMIKDQYDRLVERGYFEVVDATKTIESQHQQVRSVVEQHLSDYEPPVTHPPVDLMEMMRLQLWGDNGHVER